MSVTLHTTLGDIKIELFCEKCPKTCENFLALCASDYYKDNIFVRNVRDFMVQTGDPTNTGKGGQSIWGAPFDDELEPSLKHDQRGIVSMANNGPNKNRSQFFITYAAHPHLDLKYTIFGKSTPSIVPLSSNVFAMSPFTQILLRIAQTRNTNLFVRLPKRQVYQYSFCRFSTPATSELSQSAATATPSASDLRDVDQRKRIQEMQEYFSQYIEEYYEEDDDEVTEEKPSTSMLTPSVKEQKMLASLEDVCTLLEAERARDIVVLDLSGVAASAARHLVICTPFNARHGRALSETIRKSIKVTTGAGSLQSRLQLNNSNAAGWFCVHVNDVQIHVMDEAARARFDLESLWALEGAGSDGAESSQAESDSWLDDEAILPPPRP